MEIKRYFCLLIIILSIQFVYSQDYIEYYNQVNKADSLKYFGNYTESLNNYQDAFVKVGFVHSDKLINAGLVAIKLQKFDLADSYFQLAVKNSDNKDFLKRKEFRKNKTKFKDLKNRIPVLETEFIAKNNGLFKYKIDSLYTIDQDIRTNNKNTQENNDSIFKYLINLIDEYGFPSEKIVGYNSYRHAIIILHHNIRLNANEKYLTIFKKFIFSGEYRPEDYAWTIDQNKVWYNSTEPIFYFQILPTNKLSEIKKKEINKKRREIGLKPIEAIKESNNSFTRIW